MALVRLFFISVIGSAGVLYAFHGHLRRDRYFFWSGIVMAIYPFFISQLFISSVLAVACIATPFAASLYARK